MLLLFILWHLFDGGNKIGSIIISRGLNFHAFLGALKQIGLIIYVAVYYWGFASSKVYLHDFLGIFLQTCFQSSFGLGDQRRGALFF